MNSHRATSLVLLALVASGCRAVLNYHKRAATGIVRDTLGTSDHDPVWTVARLP